MRAMSIAKPAKAPKSEIWHGQLFLFDPPGPRSWSNSQGVKLLAILAVLELAVRPLLNVAGDRFGWIHAIWWQLGELSVVSVVACILASRFAKVPLSDLGLCRWSRWSRTEKFFFLEMLPLTIAIFSIINLNQLSKVGSAQNLLQVAIFSVLPQMIWGFYQEFLYRGLLQGEFVRRWGAAWGILGSNLIFTFGPLHAYHFLLAQKHPGHIWIFAGIFAIGLYFAIVFERSRNLWIVATLHGIGDWFIDGLASLIKHPLI
jgi:uncharacterized protein